MADGINVTEYVIEILERVKGLETTIRDYNGLREKLDLTAEMAKEHERILKEQINGKKGFKQSFINAIIMTSCSTILGGLILALLKFKFHLI